MVTPITAISDCVSWINLSIGCWWLFVIGSTFTWTFEPKFHYSIWRHGLLWSCCSWSGWHWSVRSSLKGDL